MQRFHTRGFTLPKLFCVSIFRFPYLAPTMSCVVCTHWLHLQCKTLSSRFGSMGQGLHLETYV